MPELSLILMRHGEASFDSPTDQARKLTPRGVISSKNAGLQLSTSLQKSCCAIISDATRALGTAAEVLASFGATAVHHEPQLYSASRLQELEEVITRHSKPTDKVILVIGHNPFLSEIATKLSGHSYNFSPADFAVLSIDSENWATGLGTTGCWSPKDVPLGNHQA
jgi:phosphohistidine phosphatase